MFILTFGLVGVWFLGWLVIIDPRSLSFEWENNSLNFGVSKRTPIYCDLKLYCPGRHVFGPIPELEQTLTLRDMNQIKGGDLDLTSVQPVLSYFVAEMIS